MAKRRALGRQENKNHNYKNNKGLRRYFLIGYGHLDGRDLRNGLPLNFLNCFHERNILTHMNQREKLLRDKKNEFI